MPHAFATTISSWATAGHFPKVLELLLKIGYQGPVEVDGEVFPSISDAMEKLSQYTGTMRIKPLWPLLEKEPEKERLEVEKKPEKDTLTLELNVPYEITVKAYVTKADTEKFQFHKKFNHGNPMPFRTMRGNVINRTEKMYKVDLYAYPTTIEQCLRCGKRITHPISKLYGIGPDCAEYLNIPRYESRDDLDDNMKSLQKEMKKIVWVGYVPMSAITSATPLKSNKGALTGKGKRSKL